MKSKPKPAYVIVKRDIISISLFSAQNHQYNDENITNISINIQTNIKNEAGTASTTQSRPISESVFHPRTLLQGIVEKRYSVLNLTGRTNDTVSPSGMPTVQSFNVRATRRASLSSEA